MYNHMATLVTRTVTVNSYGDSIEADGVTTNVYCRVTSADEKEKTYAESRGESAELVIILPDKGMYTGQKYVDYDNARYRVTSVKFTDTSREIRLVVGRWQTQ